MENGQQSPKNIQTAYRTSYLIAGFVKGTLTEAEARELEAWRAASEHNQYLFSELTNKKNIEQLLHEYTASDPEDYLEKSKASLQFYQRRNRIRTWSIAIAACIAGAIILLLFINPFSNKNHSPALATTDSTDILPGKDQATLTLAGGQKIILSASFNDTTVNDELSIHNKEGELVYQAIATTTPEFHTLSIPRKGSYKLKLPDGTMVYLNAESSIRYPTAFTGSERKVYVTGETFFEVAHDASKPFRVEADSTEIEALGTAFNVNAYSNEPSLIASLVQGSIKVSVNHGKAAIVKPGEEAVVKNQSIAINPSDLEEVTAWKENQFKFSNTPVRSILRQIARWYDAEIIYQDSVQVELNATISRDVPVSRLLYLLSKTDDVHFKIEGTKIIVMK